MALEISFSQGDLINSTGRQYPEGVCLGLVVQWLIAQKKLISDESKFWTDLTGSLAKAENVPLLGIGYARNAIEFQGEYRESFIGGRTTGPYAQARLNAGGLAYKAEIHASSGAFTPRNPDDIANMCLENENRYFVLCIYGGGGHAIGIHRDFALVGKSSAVQIFDPNIGKFSCNGRTELLRDLATIGRFYGNGLNASYILEAFG